MDELVKALRTAFKWCDANYLNILFTDKWLDSLYMPMLRDMAWQFDLRLIAPYHLDIYPDQEGVDRGAIQLIGMAKVNERCRVTYPGLAMGDEVILPARVIPSI